MGVDDYAHPCFLTQSEVEQQTHLAPSPFKSFAVLIGFVASERDEFM